MAAPPFAGSLATVTAETDLALLLSGMTPELVDGRFVFVSVSSPSAAHGLHPFASVIEAEGPSLVLSQQEAEESGLVFDFVAAWITLRVHSSLHAVGLTAAVSTALAQSGISCNVIAGFHHDHLLVPVERAEESMQLLLALARAAIC